MKILAHIHTLNDEDVIERSLGALLAQTRPLDAILIVDNGSTDGTLARTFPEQVTVIALPDNTGTSGAVVTGFEYALANGFDWIWLFDADTAPEADALEKLLELYDGLEEKLRQTTRLIASLPVDETDGREYHGVVFDARGVHSVDPPTECEWYEFDGTMWTGSLYKLAAVEEMGLPRADWVLDWGEYEYGYLGKKHGLHAFMHRSSLCRHNIGGATSMTSSQHRIGPLRFRVFDLPPIRCYYVVRNTIIFWLFEYEHRNPATLLPRALTVARIVLNFLVRPLSHRPQLTACLRGLWDGFRNRLSSRY